MKNSDRTPPLSALSLEPRFCPLCGPSAGKQVKYPANFSDEDFSVEVFSARRSPDRRHFQLVECTDCEMVYSDPACDPGKLAKLYTEAVVNYGSQEEQLYDSYSAMLDRALPLAKNRGTFLEIGGGHGFMLKYGVKHGFARQIEIEPGADAERKFRPAGPNAQFIRGIFEPGMLPKNSVSFACIFQMLDHVPDPAGFLQAVYDVLEPGGVLISVTHNTKALSAKILGERSPIYDIEHTFLFNPQNLTRLLTKVGFGKVDSFRVSNKYAFRHWLNLAPVPGKAKLLPLAEKTGLADVKIRLNAGNFAAVGIKQA